ncbi:hypothetical protein [Niabella sp.]|nr:hypothetical protein [Niabella sp.]
MKIVSRAALRFQQWPKRQLLSVNEHIYRFISRLSAATTVIFWP